MLIGIPETTSGTDIVGMVPIWDWEFARDLNRQDLVSETVPVLDLVGNCFTGLIPRSD